jgi:hypothetical protein
MTVPSWAILISVSKAGLASSDIDEKSEGHPPAVPGASPPMIFRVPPYFGEADVPLVSRVVVSPLVVTAVVELDGLFEFEVVEDDDVAQPPAIRLTAAVIATSATIRLFITPPSPHGTLSSTLHPEISLCRRSFSWKALPCNPLPWCVL